jgi:hypothetical protein
VIIRGLPGSVKINVSRGVLTPDADYDKFQVIVAQDARAAQSGNGRAKAFSLGEE